MPFADFNSFPPTLVSGYTPARLPTELARQAFVVIFCGLHCEKYLIGRAHLKSEKRPAQCFQST
eukprot:2376851-Rhodomonas_salina.1